MLALRINSAYPAHRLCEDMDRFFSDCFERLDPSTVLDRCVSGALPPLNVWEAEKYLYVEAEIPGVKMDDIDVSVLGDELTIKGERKNETDDGVSFHRRERRMGAFSRTIQLPTAVDAQGVQATLRDGVLTVTLSKAASVLPRRITVQTTD